MYFEKFKNDILYIKNILLKNSYETLLWLLNIMPSKGGFPLYENKNSVLFWLVHLFLLFYVYVFGTITYNKYYAKQTVDFVNSVFNLSAFVLIFNASVFIIVKKSSLKEVIQLAKENDTLAIESKRFTKEHSVFLRNIKIMLLCCYTFHFVNDVLIFTTSRVTNLGDIAVASCSGLDPLSGSPNLEFCKVVLASQEFTSIMVVFTYDVTLIFLTAHTTVMYNMLAFEINDISEITNGSNPDEMTTVSRRLKNIIHRHAKIIKTVRKMQNLFSIPIGVDFSNHAVSVLLFLVLPIDICIKFGPLVSHNILVFFLYCLLGQRLTTAVEKVEMAVYCCGWEHLSQKDRKVVLFMIKQAQNPVVLSAADVVPICIYTFANTMQIIYKFFTVFKF